jgi:hypothetical protein
MPRWSVVQHEFLTAFLTELHNKGINSPYLREFVETAKLVLWIYNQQEHPEEAPKPFYIEVVEPPLCQTIEL